MNRIKQPTLDDLILGCISLILKKNAKCTYGLLVRESFRTYPEIFSLVEFPEFPDSLKLDRPLRELRSKGLIKGSPVTYYTITNKGKDYLYKLQKDTISVKFTSQKPTRSPSFKMLGEIEKSKDFQLYLENKEGYSPSNMRIRALTGYALETPNKVIIGLLEHLLKTAREIRNADLENFLMIYISFLSSK